MRWAIITLSLFLVLFVFSYLPSKASDTPNYLLNPFPSSLEIIVNQEAPDTSDLNNVRIFEFTLDNKAPSSYEGTIYTHGPFEEIQVRRITFTQIGSMKDGGYSNLRLVNLDTGYVLQTLTAPTNKTFEFNLDVNASKPDWGGSCFLAPLRCYCNNKSSNEYKDYEGRNKKCE